MVVIFRGISGSGKSTELAARKAQVLAAKPVYRTDGNRAYVCSADNFPGLYSPEGKLDPSKLGEAHAACMRQFVDTIVHDIRPGDVIFVDNTNTTIWEISPYMLVAQSFCLPAMIIEIDSQLSDQELADRNLHGVPVNVIAAQRKRIADNPLPSWWSSTKIKTF